MRISKLKDFSGLASVAIIIEALQLCNLIKLVTLSEIFCIPTLSQLAKLTSKTLSLRQNGDHLFRLLYQLLTPGPPVRRQCGETFSRQRWSPRLDLLCWSIVCAVIVCPGMGFHAQGGAFACAHIPFYQRLK